MVWGELGMVGHGMVVSRAGGFMYGGSRPDGFHSLADSCMAGHERGAYL